MSCLPFLGFAPTTTQLHRQLWPSLSSNICPATPRITLEKMKALSMGSSCIEVKLGMSWMPPHFLHITTFGAICSRDWKMMPQRTCLYHQLICSTSLLNWCCSFRYRWLQIAAASHLPAVECANIELMACRERPQKQQMAVRAQPLPSISFFCTIHDADAAAASSYCRWMRNK